MLALIMQHSAQEGVKALQRKLTHHPGSRRTERGRGMLGHTQNAFNDSIGFTAAVQADQSVAHHAVVTILQGPLEQEVVILR